MKEHLVLGLVSSDTKLSIFMEESTSSSNKNNLVIYVREILGGESP
jgi:hypothetical protein